MAQSNPTKEAEKLYTARLIRTERSSPFLAPGRDTSTVGEVLVFPSEASRPRRRCRVRRSNLCSSRRHRRIEPHVIDAFDLTLVMLEEFQAELDARGIILVRLKQANVLALGQFPSSWSDYDLIVCTSMLEYLAKADFS
jgi:hypothetical protein